MRIAPLFAALCMTAMLAPALACAQGVPMRIRGTIEKVDGNTLVVTSRAGEAVTMAMAPDMAVRSTKKASLADIKAGDFVGSAAMKGKDGKYHALEVHIFPENMRGTGEGNRPWDEGPDSAMINATVGEVVGQSDGRVLTMRYAGGEAQIEVAPNTPIVALAPGDPGMLKPGRAIFVFALKQGDGNLVARFATVEVDGVKPPM